ncbi:hypothetical protein Tco_1324143 [Tanacetum coccineum]
MSSLKYAETHNLVVFLEKPKESVGFEGIINFLNASSIRYALTVNPTIYTSCIKQFWATAKVKTVNGEVQIQALVDGKKAPRFAAILCSSVLGMSDKLGCDDYKQVRVKLRMIVF